MILTDNAVITMANPFLSGRIPPKLFMAIEDRMRLTGESRTDILITALSRYLEVPIAMDSVDNDDWRRSVEERLAAIEAELRF